MGTIGHDVRYAARVLMRSPGITAVTVLTLALGVGATTAIFSIVNGVLLRPLAYPESDRLVYVHEFISTLADKLPVLPVSARHFLEWRQRCSSFENLSLLCSGPVNLTGKDEPEVLVAVRASANLFETLRVQPALGRTFAAEEEAEGGYRVVVISDRFWRRKFHGTPLVLGATLTLDQEVYTVIGVLPADLRLPNPRPITIPEQPDVLIPKILTASERNDLMGNFEFHVIARLKSGVTREMAAAELDVIGAQLVKMAGEQFQLRAIVKSLKEAVVQDSRRGLLIVLGAVGSVLLIACLNLAILHLVRAEGRSGESAIRMALGANRWQLLRQALTEMFLLIALGATLGVMMAGAGLGGLIRITPGDMPRLNQVRMDGNVLGFALLLAGVTMLLFGLLPAWRMASNRTEQVLQPGGRTATTTPMGLRLRNILVAVEVSLSVVLLVAAGLLLRSFMRVMHVDKGFYAPAVLAVDVAPSPATYGTEESIRAFHERLLTHLTSAPGIRSTAIVSRLPLRGQGWLNSVSVPGDARPALERPMADVRFVSADYFLTMGIPLRAGRTFDDGDKARRVAVISETLAGLLWPGQEVVVGRRFSRGGGECEVIGVVKDVLTQADRQPVPMVYHPYWDGAPAATTVVARAAGDPLTIAGSVREAIRNTDADLPVFRVCTMREILEMSVSQRRFLMLLTSTFAVCALVLAALGIYGVVSYSATRRTREMGIRMAFGARPFDIYHIVLRRAMAPVLLGLFAGMVGACAAGRLLRSLLYEISPSDPLIIVTVVAAMFVVAVAACYVPARRAARIDPMVALRYE